MPGRHAEAVAVADMAAAAAAAVAAPVKVKATRILRGLQCGLNITLVLVSAVAALAAAIARWTDLLEFDGEPIVGHQREIASILHETIFQELMVSVFCSSVVVLFIAILGISGSYVTDTPNDKDNKKRHCSSSRPSLCCLPTQAFRTVYAVFVSVTVLIEGIIACVLTWFYTWHNGESYATTQCPYSDFSEGAAVDILKCPIDYAIKAYILDSEPAWTNLQDVWYMCGYFCGSNDFCSAKDSGSKWQTTGRFCTSPVPGNATQGIFAVYTGDHNGLQPGAVSTQPLRPTIFNFIGSITLPTTVFFWLVFLVSALLLANTCLIGKQQAERRGVVGSPVAAHRRHNHPPRHGQLHSPSRPPSARPTTTSTRTQDLYRAPSQ